MTLTGTWPRSLDEKGRLAVPARVRAPAPVGAAGVDLLATIVPMEAEVAVALAVVTPATPATHRHRAATTTMTETTTTTRAAPVRPPRAVLAAAGGAVRAAAALASGTMGAALSTSRKARRGTSAPTRATTSQCCVWAPSTAPVQ